MTEDTKPAVVGTTVVASGDQATTPRDAAYWQVEAERAFARRAESVAERDDALAKLQEYETQNKSARAQEVKRLADAGEYKASYEQATEQLAQLLPMADEYKVLREHVTSQVDAQLKELPPEYQDLIPAGLSLNQQLAQVERLRRLVGKQATTQPTVPPATPPPASIGSVADIADPVARRKALLDMDPKERAALLSETAKAWKWGG